MKFFFVLASLTLLSCKPPLQGSQVKDISIAKTNGEVVLFYREGDNVVLKKCQNLANIVNRKDCGDANNSLATKRYPIEVFNSYLKKAFIIDTSKYTQKYKDLAQQSQNSNNPITMSEANIQEIITENTAKINEISNFMKINGKSTELDKQFKAIKNTIKDAKKTLDLVKEINSNIIKTVDDWVFSKEITSLSYSKSNDVIYALLNNYIKLSTKEACLDSAQYRAEATIEEERLQEELSDAWFIPARRSVVEAKISEFRKIEFAKVNKNRELCNDIR